MRERQPAHPRMDIPIPQAVYQQLLTASVRTGFKKEDWEIATEAIDEWLRRHEPDALSMPAVKGYQWKSLFLPDGTLLRTVFGRKNHHCLVESDAIVHDGKPVSPSLFVNAVGGVRRNAWRSIWILLPHTDQWQLADTLRIRARPARERKPARVRHASPTQSGAAGAPASAPPGAIARAAPADAAALTMSEEPCVQLASADQVQSTHLKGEGPSGQQCIAPCAPLSPPRCTCGAISPSSGDDRMSPLLREELRSLLNRMCGMDEERRRTRRWPGASPTQTGCDAIPPS